MAACVALLRAVNVGGTGRLPMRELVALREGAGFTDVRTYVASGNVALRSRSAPGTVKAALERRLEACAGKPVAVVVRTAAEPAEALAANPFPAAKAGTARTLDTVAPLVAMVRETGG